MNQEAMVVGMVLLALGQIASIALTVKSLFGAQRRELLPSPLQVSAAEKYVTEQRFLDHCKMNDDRSSSIEASLRNLIVRMDQLDRSDEARTSGLHRRLNIISTNVATLAGSIAAQTGQHMKLAQDGDPS